MKKIFILCRQSLFSFSTLSNMDYVIFSRFYIIASLIITGICVKANASILNNYVKEYGCINLCLTHSESSNAFKNSTVEEKKLEGFNLKKIHKIDLNNFVYMYCPTARIRVTGHRNFCVGGSATLTANPGMSYLWSTGATTQSIIVNASGSYSVTITSNNGTSSTSAPVTINVFPLPISAIAISGNTNLCSGGFITLTTNSCMSSYLWSTGATTRTISVTTSGNYSVIITNHHRCSSSTSINVLAQSNVLNAGTIGPNQTHCGAFKPTLLNSLANATANQGDTIYYQWLKSNVNVPNTLSNPYWQAITNATATIYQPDSVFQSTFYIRCSRSQVCTFVGNTTESNIVSILVNPIPIATISPAGTTTFCPNDSVTFTAPANMSTYLWSNGITTPTIQVMNEGNYSLQITDSNGCSSTSSITTLINALPADFNKSGSVDVNDFISFGPAFGTSCNACPKDLNHDGTIDISDYLIFVASYGLSCQ